MADRQDRNPSSGRDGTGSRLAEPPSSALNPPALSLPKGGGALRAIGEKFAANPVTGTGALAIPIPTSPGRSELGPSLSLSYDSSSGNGPFGIGWSLSLPSITRKTDKGMPRYVDADEPDTFILSGAEDLVPVLVEQGGALQRLRITRSTEGRTYRIERYRPRVEGLFARIERWTDLGSGAVHWRSQTRENVTARYGMTDESRIADPADPSRVFSWLICESYDDKGNAVVYEYAAENDASVDRGQANERNRVRTANRYLKRIKYGNRVSRLIQPDLTQASWLFEVVFDYDEAHYEEVDLDPTRTEAEQPRFIRAAAAAGRPWATRPDPFSSHRAGFEVRTYRRCRRILMFHHVPDLPTGEQGYDGLVGSTEFDYADLDYGQLVAIEDELAHHGSTRFASFLRAVTQSGYVRDDTQAVIVRNGVQYATYLKQSLPPLEFEYSKAVIQDQVLELDTASLDNLPAGLDGSAYQWVDLDGEGVAGILTEQAGAWYYKPNLGDGRFGPLQTITTKPAGAGLSNGRQQLVDLAGDGQLDLVALAGPTPGFYERTHDEGWEPFRAFRQLPSIPWDDPNLRFIDLDGDGHADVLITEQDVFTWHPSLAEAGFGPARGVRQPLDEERGPRLVLADGAQTIYLADMCGDGLTDLVRIRNGEVCYWPNQGYGRFGAKVTMDNAPWFDHPDLFEQRRVRLADIDGSGAIDIIYLARDGVRLYLNQSGNRWSEARRLTQFPRIDNVAAVMTADLLGNGTACLVWSSPLPADARRPLRYIDLMGGTKPHLLIAAINNLGAETRVHYAPSTRFYLADKRAGRPWVTRLPFPVHVVERVVTLDRISGSRFVTRYAYHHGYFDGIEREFGGFGMVEQWDTEEYAALAPGGELAPAANVDPASHVPPVLTRTWFHNGAYLGHWRISRLFEQEYYREPGLADDDLRAMLLADTELPAGLTAEEEREACRSLRGAMLRKEVYGLDGSDRAGYPYAVSERNYTVRRLQPHGPNRYAVYFTHPREAVDFQYERALFDVSGQRRPDPRVSHSITLDVDEFGNVLQAATIGYGRRHDDPDPLLSSDDRRKQGQILLTYTENDYTNIVDEADAYRAPLMCESRTWELVKVQPAGNRAGVTNLIRFDELRDRVQEAGDGAHDLEYGDVSAAGATEAHPYRRLIQRQRILFRRNDLTAFSPLGQLESMALPGEGYQLAMTPALLSRVFTRRATGLPDEDLLPAPAPLLEGKGEDQGGYVALDGAWWLPSGRAFYDPAVNVSSPALTAAQEATAARQRFYRPRLFVDPFEQRTLLNYDDHSLLATRTRDAVDNEVAADNDYRVLQPRLITDPNRNRAAVAFNALGMVVATALMGKEGDSVGDLLEDVDANPPLASVQDFMADPLASATSMLGKATTRVVYDLGRYRRAGQAPCAATLKRETHVHDPGGGQTRIQVSFSYADGFGRELQKKVQAEAGDAPQRQADVTLPTGDVRPGDLVRDAQGALVQARTSPRWAGTGRTVFNNKGKPVRQYEPFFSTTHLHEHELELTEAGVSRVLFYDPVERVVATLHPNHSYEKIVFDPWKQSTYDLNDTIAPSGRETGDPRTDPDIAGYVREYFTSQPAGWQTWQAQRSSGALGPQELDAAHKAARHADTPTVAYLDTLGRPFLTVAHNRFERNGATVDEHDATRTELDIEGNRLALRDARDRIAVRVDYDLLSRPIHQASMEAGERWMLLNAAGTAIRTFDSRGFVRRMTYDGLRRLTGLYVSENGVERLAERTVYGEQVGDAGNHRTRVHQVFDGAGIVTSEAYDFKGNILQSRRDLLPDYRHAVDWQQNPTANDGSFTSRTTYDALNRPLSVTTPDGSVYRPSFNEAGLLEQVDVNLRGAATRTPFITNIDYTAKGFRKRIAYGNGAVATYQRDPLTCRVTRLTTTRPANPDATAAQIFQNPAIVQDLSYTYDPIGNITHLADAAHKRVFHNNQQIDPVASYTYDALYRLIEAHGREHIGQTGVSGSPPDGNYRDHPFAGLAAHPNDLQALRTYTERYEYDAAGNIAALRHVANGGSWTRTYDYAETSLLEAGTQSNRLTRVTLGNGLNQTEAYTYDGHGNTISMPHLPNLSWDFEDQLRQVDLGGGGTAYYVYSASGERVRKVIDTQNGTRHKERLYLGGFEIYRQYNGSGSSVTLERESLHVMDDKQRIALVETQTVENGSAVNASVPLQRYQLGNHLDSACIELADDGALISYEEYHPYGTTAFQAGRSAAEVSLKRYRYTGIERDEETGLSYHSARYYAPWLGRWANCDPAGTRGGLNLYAYGGANPTSRRDTSGLDSEWCIFCNPFSEDVEFAPKQFLKEEVAPRAVGALKAGAGLAGMAAGAALCETGIGCAIGGPLIAVSADYGGSGLAQVWHGSPQPTVLGHVAGPKVQEIQGQVVEAAGFAYALAEVAVTATVNRLARREVTSTTTSAPPKTTETPHVGGSSKSTGTQNNRLTVADAGPDKCVGNVCAIMKNQELKAGPASGYTTSEIEREFSINLGRLKSGAPNPKVATPERAIGTIEEITGLKVVNPKPVNFAAARGEGQYAVFFNESHVVYAKIGPGGRVSILDPNVGRGWRSWSDFLRYAESKPALYGANPARNNKSFLFREPE